MFKKLTTLGQLLPIIILCTHCASLLDLTKDSHMADLQVSIAPFTKPDQTTACELPQAVWWAPYGELPDGRLVIAGGQVPDTDATKKFEHPVKDAFVFDPKSCEITSLNPMAEFHAGTDGVTTRSHVLFLGGSAATAIEAYNLETSTIQTIGQLSNPRSGSAQVELADGRILITGGYDKSSANTGVLASAEIFDPKTRATEQLTNSMHNKRAGHTITALADGTVLVTGGSGDGIGSAEIFDPKTGAFTLVASPMISSRKDHRAIVANDGKIWLVGGTASDDNAPMSLEYFDPTDNKFHSTKLTLSVGREDSSVVYSSELNAIIVVGGQQRGTINGHKNPPVAVVDVLDLQSGKTSTAQLPFGARDDGALTILAGDANDHSVQVLLFSGVQELYDAAGATNGKATPQLEVITLKK